jgi:hypothetical protein
MTHTLAAQLSKHSPAQLVHHLQETYYSPLRRLCDDTLRHTAQLSHAGLMKPTFLYRSLSQKLIEQLRLYLDFRDAQLSELVMHQHEYCKLKSSLIREYSENGIEESESISCRKLQRQIKELMFRLHTIGEPLYSRAGHIKPYEALRAIMLDIDTNTTMLFYLEEALLIPKIAVQQDAHHMV